jgi:serine protein kinase
MRPLSDDPDATAAFIESLSSFSRLHRAQRWEGTFGDFLSNILPVNPAALARTSHEYIWDMLRWHGRKQPEASDGIKARELFKRELFGIDEPLSRVVDYFKAAAAGSDVGRRLLLLLGPPSGGERTKAPFTPSRVPRCVRTR